MSDEIALRVPPHSAEAEQALLGALLIDSTAWEKVALVISPKDFYRAANRMIYEQIEMLVETTQPVDITTVAQALEDAGVLDRVGGAKYLAEISTNTPGPGNVKRYAELIREKALLRNVIRVCTEVTELALTPGADARTALEEAERRMFELHHRRMVKPPTTFKQILVRVFESLDDRYHKQGEITGLSTGFSGIDRKTAGLQRGDLVIVAGRPSMGKTAFAMNVAEHVALEKRLPVAVFSIEMSDMQLVQRMLGSVGGIDQHRLRTGMLTDDDWSKTCKAVERLHDSPFVIEETSQLTITELRARARRIVRDNPGLALIIIDYLQLMASQAKTQSERTQEIGDISRGLKALAKELDIPVLALSQLNRAVEQRMNKRPMMSDLKDSGSIEQDADVIIFLYRDEVYHEDSSSAGYAEAVIGKQRNGAVGTVYLRFVKEETRFQDCDWTPPKKAKGKKKGFDATSSPPVDADRADIHG